MQLSDEQLRLIANSNRVMDSTFLFDNPWDMEQTCIPYTFPSRVAWDTQMADDPEWTYMLARCGFVLDLARAQECTGEPRYGQRALDLIESFIADAPLDDPRFANCWRSLDVSLRLDNWLEAVQLLDIDAREGFRVMFDQSIRQHVQLLVQADNTFLCLSNWGFISNCLLLQGALYLHDGAVVALALERVAKSISLQVLSDGVHWEQSPMYHGECLNALLAMIKVARRYNLELDVMYLEGARRMCHAALQAMKPNGHHFQQSDSDDIDIRTMLALGSLLLSDSMLRAAGPTQLEYPFTAAEQAQYLALAPTVPPYSSVFHQASGNIYLRSGWDHDSSVAHIHCGSLGSGHGHADLLHVDYVGRGEDILIDCGRGTYVDGQVRRALRSAAMHNTIVLDGEETFVQTDSWGYSRRGRYLPPAQSFHGDWNWCQGSMLTAGNELVTRNVLQLGDDVLVLLDAIADGNTHQCTRSFHFHPDGELTPSNGHWSYGHNAVVASVWIDPSEHGSIGTGPCSPHYNQVVDHQVLTATSNTQGSASRWCVLAMEPEATVHEIPVVSEKTGIPFSPDAARAFVISLAGAQPYTVVWVLHPCIEGVDLLRAGSLVGYGSILVGQGDRQEVFAI